MTRLLILALLCSISLQAQEGPFKRTSPKANLGQKIIHLLDNSTVGLIQTTLGAGHIIMYAVLNTASDREKKMPRMEVHNNEAGETSQIVIDERIPWFAGAYSLGLFQVGGYAHDHEGSHSVASAALGPLYLPAVGLSYLAEGHSGSFFEDWADLEVDPAPYSLTADPQVGLGQVEMNGRFHDVAVFKFSIDQGQRQDSYGLQSHKVLSWFNTNVVAPLANHNSPEEMPTLIEFDLLHKRLNLIVDNIALYLGGEQEVRNSIQVDQKYFSFRSNPALERVHLEALSWSTKYGVTYNLNNDIAITPKIGIHASVDAFSTHEAFYNFGASTATKDLDWTLARGASVGLEVSLYNYLSLETSYQKTWRSNDFFNTSFEAKVSNKFRSPIEKFGLLNWIEVSAGYRNEKWKIGLDSHSSAQYFVALGARF